MYLLSLLVGKKNKDSLFLKKLFKDKVALVSTIVIFSLGLAAILAPWIAPHNPFDVSTLNIMDSQMPPWWQQGGSTRFLFGTDVQGRGILSTILYGLRISLIIGFLAVFLQALIGIFIGLIAGYCGGFIDALLMRIADIQLSFSTTMVAIIVLSIFQKLFGIAVYNTYSLVIIVFIIGITEWPKFARTMRSGVLRESKKSYVDAAKVMGFGAVRILVRHIFPNCLTPLLVIATLQIAEAIIIEASLSFLGLGMPISTPSLGSLISSGFTYIFSGIWWITVFPGVVLVCLVLAINLLGDWLQDYFNPKLYKG